MIPYILLVLKRRNKGDPLIFRYLQSSYVKNPMLLLIMYFESFDKGCVSSSTILSLILV